MLIIGCLVEQMCCTARQFSRDEQSSSLSLKLHTPIPTLNRAAIFHLPRCLYSQARPQARYRVASSPTEFSDHAIYYSKIFLKRVRQGLYVRTVAGILAASAPTSADVALLQMCQRLHVVIDNHANKAKMTTLETHTQQPIRNTLNNPW
jgi:hypothetical protein